MTSSPIDTLSPPANCSMKKYRPSSTIVVSSPPIEVAVVEAAFQLELRRHDAAQARAEQEAVVVRRRNGPTSSSVWTMPKLADQVDLSVSGQWPPPPTSRSDASMPKSKLRSW